MRPIVYLIIIAAAGYLGYNYYMERNGGTTAGGETPAAETASTPGTSPDQPATPPAKTPPVFKSKIVIPDGPPGTKHLAKPGIYYVLERTSIEHATGVAAVVPGEEVRLLTRKGGGIVRVVSGKHEFELKESQLTNDLEVAQEAERKFVLANPPARQ
jgi:hypothetical protein